MLYIPPTPFLSLYRLLTTVIPIHLGTNFLRRQLIIVVVLGLVIGAGFYVGSFLRRPRRPTLGLKTLLSFGETQLDIGSVQQGTIVQSTLQLSNDTSSCVEIDHIQPSCGCLKANVDSDSVLPGKHLLIHFMLDSTGKAGVLRVAALVHFANPTAATLLINISGTVTTGIDMSPAFISGGDVRTDRIIDYHVRLRTEPDATLSVDERGCQQLTLALGMPQVESGASNRGTARDLRITLDTHNATPGRYDENIRISKRSLDGTYTFANLPIVFNVLSDFTADPTSLYLGNLSVGGKRVAKLGVVGVPTDKLAGVKVISNDPDVTARGYGGDWQIEVNLPTTGAFGPYRCDLIVSSETSRYKIIVPVYLFIDARR